MDASGLQRIIQDYKITGPENGGLSEPGKYNLIFSTGTHGENKDPL